jgi:hypothetical protein
LEEGVNITASELCNAALAKYRNLFETEKWKLITVALSANESKVYSFSCHCKGSFKANYKSSNSYDLFLLGLSFMPLEAFLYRLWEIHIMAIHITI